MPESVVAEISTLAQQPRGNSTSPCAQNSWLGPLSLSHVTSNPASGLPEKTIPGYWVNDTGAGRQRD